MPDPGPAPLDLATVDDVVERVLVAQARAVATARGVAAPIATAVDLVAGRFAAGGRLFLAAADPVAGRVLDLVTADLLTEFGLADFAVARLSDEEATPTPRDAVLVVATGADPEPATAAARRRGAATVVVTAGPAAVADVVIDLAGGAETVDGLARLGAATSLKAVLDALTTAVMAQLGRVHDDLPIDLVATDDATRARVVAMVTRIAGAAPTDAERAATAAGFDTRVAVLTLVGGLDPVRASTLAANRRTLRDAMADLPHRPPGVGLPRPPSAAP